MSENLTKHLSKLAKRGPHRVLVGDLAYAGLPGKVYTPAEGNGIPAVAFGHDWMTGVKHYHGTLRHLASWGIAVAAPDTETGFNPDHRRFAADLDSALQILAGVKLGVGQVTVAPGKLGVIGHGMGGGCAVLAAADQELVHAVAAVYPSVTAPPEHLAARSVLAPGLVIGGKHDLLVAAGNAPRLAANWRGPVVYRELDKGTAQGFSENILVKLLTGLARPESGARETARGLLTGFLLHQLDRQNKYSGFSDPTATAKHITSLSGADLDERVAGLRAGARQD